MEAAVKRRKLDSDLKDGETGFDVPNDQHLENEKQTSEYAEVAPTPTEKSPTAMDKKSDDASPGQQSIQIHPGFNNPGETSNKNSSQQIPGGAMVGMPAPQPYPGSFPYPNFMPPPGPYFPGGRNGNASGGNGNAGYQQQPMMPYWGAPPGRGMIRYPPMGPPGMSMGMPTMGQMPMGGGPQMLVGGAGYPMPAGNPGPSGANNSPQQMITTMTAQSEKNGPSGSSTGGNDPQLTGHAPILLYMYCDDDSLSAYQCLVRRQIELFEARNEDIETNAQGRNKPIHLGQVGIRCAHCKSLPPRQRARASVYYPAKLYGLYQAAQNMATIHLCQTCRNLPAQLRSELVSLRERKSSAGGGKKYWGDGARVLGVVETEDGLRFERR